MSKKLSSRQLRTCGGCAKRKNLEWDARRELCHDCLVKRVEYVILQHKENRMPYHVAETELMERLRINRLEAEEKLHPKPSEWTDDAQPLPITAGQETVKWDEDGNLVLSDGRLIPTQVQEEE
jgi:hypothetical protein